MDVLNLVYPEKGNVRYRVSQFPDGQQTIDLVGLFPEYESVVIKSRLNSFRDLELIICAAQALKNINVSDIKLYVPYFIGGRSDRKFQTGGVHYLKQVIAPLINMQGFSKVTILDPHSDVIEAVINNFEKEHTTYFHRWARNQIREKSEDITIISPDAGAYKKIFDVAKFLDIPKIITAEKIRDLKTGNIVKTNVPVTVYDAGRTFIIIDDICDGGRTFVEMAKVIRSTVALSSISNEPTKIYLVVTHGIFSAGFQTLGDYFDGIFTTNSVKDIANFVGTNSKLEPIDLKQLNIFQ